jgi:redox-sensitive bicupin YhaK (pirin superfamily)
MITVRPAAARGITRIDWLDSRHSFSFAEYVDPEHMGFRALRVINDDRIAAGGGFPTHPHRDMEILTYVLDGALEHRDSLGTGSVIRPGEVQIMSAGTGIRHSEFNHSETEGVHLLQIWMLPERRGLAPRYDQKAFDAAARRGRLKLVAAHDAREGAVRIFQDIDLFAGNFDRGESAVHALKPGRHAWIQMARGSAAVNGTVLREGDGAALSDEPQIKIDGVDNAEVLLFDLD